MQRPARRYLFLYTRLPDYFYCCVEHLLKMVSGAEATIVCYPKDNSAPYEYAAGSNISIISKQNFLRGHDPFTEIKPDLVYVAGWGDKEYNQKLRQWRGLVPVIMGMDNPWKATLRQYAAVTLAQLFGRKRSDYIWVPGYPQYEFARRLGFAPARILKGLYCADVQKFKKTDTERKKRILFVGRMVDYKRPGWLLEAFVGLLEQYPELGDWELQMVGNGPLQEALQEKYRGVRQVSFISFVQPAELVKYYREAAVFCLPSMHEHWGVVVQEAAAAGLALLLSDTCGAASAFLVNGHNGYLFGSYGKEDFKNKLLKLLGLDMPALTLMGKRSEVLAERITQDYWCASLNSVLRDH